MADSVGIRALKAHLSAYVDRARVGESITVTDRGRPVARLVPVHAGESALERLIAEEIATRPTARGSLPPPIEGQGAASDLVAEQRR